MIDFQTENFLIFFDLMKWQAGRHRHRQAGRHRHRHRQAGTGTGTGRQAQAGRHRHRHRQAGTWAHVIYPRMGYMRVREAPPGGAQLAQKTTADENLTMGLFSGMKGIRC